MGLFNTLLSKILGRAPKAPGETPPPNATTTSSAGPLTGTAVSSGAVVNPSVDISEVLGELAAKNPEKLDWRRSIVDLMKLVGMDSSLSARKELAKELNYTGDTDDSAKMNIWLHKEVLKRLAANGGKVPPELLD